MNIHRHNLEFLPEHIWHWGILKHETFMCNMFCFSQTTFWRTTVISVAIIYLLFTYFIQNDFFFPLRIHTLGTSYLATYIYPLPLSVFPIYTCPLWYKTVFNGRDPSQELHKCNVHRQFKQSWLTLECAACKSSAVYSLCISAKEKTGFESPVMIQHITRCDFASLTHLNVGIGLWLA